jgi:two-component system NtrC family response regulator
MKELQRDPPGTILVVENETAARRATQLQLENLGYQVRVADDLPSAFYALRRDPVDLVISNLHLPSGSGLDLLRNVRADYPDTKFVVLTTYGSVNTAIEAMKSGAYDYLTQPLHPVELQILVDRLFEQRRLSREVQVLRNRSDQRFGFKNLIGQSPGLASAVDSAARAARTDAPVLLTGETGTGKELLARAIHFASDRRDQPFVVVNCGSIPRDLVESELYGYVKGAFTGATAHKLGRAEIADGGTLFLDEIAEMPLEAQVRLLRLIQEGEVQKIGAPETSYVDVRLIAATHRKLEDLVRAGSFREDVYYRLAVIPIELPPLRERSGDVPSLVRHIFQENKKKYNRPELQLSPELLPYFARYDWPGNIRQLGNCITRLVVLAQGQEISFADLPSFLREPSQSAVQGTTLDFIERQAVIDALEKSNWNQSGAARALGVSRKVLRGRLLRYGLKKPQGITRAARNRANQTIFG